MIDGFKVYVTAAELVEHLRARAKHHHEKAGIYERQKVHFADAPEVEMSADPVKGMKEAGARHAQKASLFDFWSKHIPAGETYLLNTHELDSLELTTGSRGW